jgi:hypothetical protein
MIGALSLRDQPLNRDSSGANWRCGSVLDYKSLRHVKRISNGIVKDAIGKAWRSWELDMG